MDKIYKQMDETITIVMVYILIVVIVYISKPLLIYDDINNKFKEFGLDENKSIIAFPVLVILLSIVVYFVMKIIMKMEIKLKK